MKDLCRNVQSRVEWRLRGPEWNGDSGAEVQTNIFYWLGLVFNATKLQCYFRHYEQNKTARICQAESRNMCDVHLYHHHVMLLSLANNYLTSAFYKYDPKQ